MSGASPVVHSIQGRFLSQDYYNEKLTGFRRYDPSSWWSTLVLSTSPFLMWPCGLLVGWTFILFVMGKMLPFTAPLLALGPQVHTVLGAALSFVMVFRTNTAYSRWWEARLLWGVVNNTTRSVISRAPSMIKNDAVFVEMATGFMSFAICLKNHLRDVKTEPSELGAMLPYALIVQLQESRNPPLAAISNLSKTIREGIKTESPEDQLVANASFFQLSTALDAIANTVGACERVKNTPTPFGYVSALRGFLLLWLFTMPFTLIGTYGFVAVPAMALVGFLFLNLEMMAMEIEQPFGDDPDDLPLEEYCLGIERVCLDFLKRSPISKA